MEVLTHELYELVLRCITGRINRRDAHGIIVVNRESVTAKLAGLMIGDVTWTRLLRIIDYSRQ